MGLFGFIADVFETIVIKPVVAVHKGVTGLIGVDPFKDPVKFATLPITAPLKLIAPVVASISGAILPPQAGPQRVGAGVPAFQQVRLPVGQGTIGGSSVPISRQGISGGTAAFSSFVPQTLTGGNPAWRFSGLSSVRSREREVFSVRSQGRWVQSGHSVRLLR